MTTLPSSYDTRLPLTSQDITADRVVALRRLFPEAFAEGRIDFDRLRAVLGDAVSSGPERYGLSWAGKSDALHAVQTLSTGTLAPAPDESVNFDTSENVIIEGDNLEVLKLLQKSYHNQVKMIYIDPPYNTGNDFLYPDNFREGVQNYLRFTGQVNGEGVRMETNKEENGRFHSNWLNMMWPRLFLAKNLLKNDGVILVSVDDHEIHNLRVLMDEIFYEENLVAQAIWNLKSGPQAGHFTRSHEYVIVYAKSKTFLSNFGAIETGNIVHGALKKISRANPASEIEFPEGVEFEGDDAEFSGTIGGSEKQFILSEKMVFQDGKLASPVRIKAGWAMKNQVLSWLTGEETVDSKGQKIVRFYFNRQGILCYEKERGTYNPKTVMSEIATTKQGTDEVTELMGEKLFDFPKPVALLKYLTKFVTEGVGDAIVMDFFAGSGTSAQAVLELNKEDGGNRKFILVQLPEPTPEGSTARQAGYETIADITKERVRRVIKRLDSSVGKDTNAGGGGGYKIVASMSSNSRPATSRPGTPTPRPRTPRGWPGSCGFSRTTSCRGARRLTSSTN